jgi:hypothetical protein
MIRMMTQTLLLMHPSSKRRPLAGNENDRKRIQSQTSAANSPRKRGINWNLLKSLVRPTFLDQRSNRSDRLLPDIPNPLPTLLKLQDSAIFADESPRIEKPQRKGSSQPTGTTRKASPVAPTSPPVRHKTAVNMPPVDSDATGTPDIHLYLRLTIDSGLLYLRTRL